MRRGKRGPESVKRAGARVRREVWREARATARRHVRGLVVMFVSWVGMILLMVVGVRVIGGSTAMAAFFAGIMVGVLPLFSYMVLVSWGLASRQMGGEAERWTADELAKLSERRGWVVFHDVPIERGNVDHVAVGPGRVYAIETKWTSYVAHSPVIDRWAAQAQWRAKGLERLMAARGVVRDVLPVLVVWGPGAREHLGERAKLIDNTRVVTGTCSADWLARMNEAADRVFIDGPARSAIAGLIEEAEQV